MNFAEGGERLQDKSICLKALHKLYEDHTPFLLYSSLKNERARVIHKRNSNVYITHLLAQFSLTADVVFSIPLNYELSLFLQ